MEIDTQHLNIVIESGSKYFEPTNGIKTTVQQKAKEGTSYERNNGIMSEAAGEDANCGE